MEQGKAPNSTDRKKLRAAICRLMPRWQASELTGFRYLPGGYSNDNYRFEIHGSAYVLRLPLANREPAEWQTERVFYETARTLHIPALVAMSDRDGTMITRWVAGELLVDAAPTDAQLVAHTQQLHRALATHAPGSRAYDPVALARRQVATASKAAPRVVSAAIQSAKWRPSE